MKAIVAGLLFAAVSMLLILFSATDHDLPVVHAGRGCTDAALIGTYAVKWSGFTNPNGTQGHQVPWAGAGTARFDGEGNVSSNYSTSINGEVFTAQTTSGTYTVNSDCTASLSFTSGDAAGFTASMVLIGDAKEVFGVDIDTGDTLTFDLKKQW